MINVVNKYKTKNLKNVFYIGRGSILGNPFTHMDLEGTKASFKCESREEAIERYEQYLNEKIYQKDTVFLKELEKIKEMSKAGEVNLVCFCKPKSCHGDVIKKTLEEKF